MGWIKRLAEFVRSRKRAFPIIKGLLSIVSPEEFRIVARKYPDRREFVRRVAERLEISEVELIDKLSVISGYRMTEFIRPVDLERLPFGLTLSLLRRAACIPNLSNSNEIICVDPSLVESLLVKRGIIPPPRAYILGSWANIGAALEESERGFITKRNGQLEEAQSYNQRMLLQVVSAIAREANAHGAQSFVLLLSSTDGRYEFLTSDGSVARGDIASYARDSVIQGLLGLKDESIKLSGELTSTCTIKVGNDGDTISAHVTLSGAKAAPALEADPEELLSEVSNWSDL